jgi:hypothetical protein
MKMMKFPVLAGSAFTSPNKKHFYINVHDIYEVDGAALDADACTIKFANAASTEEGIITIVMDGADADEKVANANKLADYIAEKMQEVTSRMQKKPFDLIPTLAEIHTASGITKTGGAGNDAIISITLS